MNSKSEIHIRNINYLKKYLNLSFDQYLDKMKLAGKPKKYGKDWSESNPTCGRCGSVTNALRLSGKIPERYIACGQKSPDGGSHYYFINPEINEIIDLTQYQMLDEYDYGNYHRSFFPQVSNNVRDILTEFGLEIDKKIFNVRTVNNTLIVSKTR